MSTNLKLFLIRQQTPDHIRDIPTQPVQQERQRQPITRLLKVVLDNLRSLCDDPAADRGVSK